MKTSIPKLRSVRFKSGGEIRLLERPDPLVDRAFVARCVARLLDKHVGDVGGFAIVVWGSDGGSICDARNTTPGIPSILIPDFVRSRLLAHKIIGWVHDDLNEG